VENDSWLAVPHGGIFTCLGIDPVTAKEFGASQLPSGQWTKLPKTGLVWIAPRLVDEPWAQGWYPGQTLTEKDEYHVDEEVDDAAKMRLQQPYQYTEENPRLYEPIDNDPTSMRDHEPKTTEEGFPIRRSVKWFKVREAGTYLVTFSAKIGLNGPWSGFTGGGVDVGPYIGLGLFAARPKINGKSSQVRGPDFIPLFADKEIKLRDENNKREVYEVYRQPATLATRSPIRFEVQLPGGGTITVT